MQLCWFVLLVGLLANYGVELVTSEDCYDERDDCYTLVEKMPSRNVLDDYCLSWKHTQPIQQCRKTCHLCKTPIGPGNAGCRDESDECIKISRDWYPNNARAVADYCEDFKNDPTVQKCKKTCPNLCGRGPAQGCRDESERCKDIVAYGHGRQADIENYCSRNRHTSLVQMCKGTCRNLCADNGQITPDDCRDEVAVCRDIVTSNNGDVEKILKYCHLYRENETVKKCKKTCQKCQDKTPHPSDPLSHCKDESKQCKDIVTMHKGVDKDIQHYCELYRENDTVKKCKKTCRRFCQDKMPHPSGRLGHCEDESEQCKDIVTMHKGVDKDIQDYCERHRENDTVKNCKRTCWRLCQRR